MPTALSVLSHVVHGYVGNRATTFPLQYEGWDVDVLNTTNLSNHPGYGTFKGASTSPELIKDLFLGLRAIGDLSAYDVFLTGYAPNDAILTAIIDEIVPVFAAKKAPVWVVDPILGDNGKLYVLEKVVDVYRRALSLGNVTLATPNQFELETLSGVSISSWATLKEAFSRFNAAYNVPFVVLSSVEIDGALYGVGCSQQKLFYHEIERIDCSFNGSGDVFVALLTHEFYSAKFNLTPDVLGIALHRLRKILVHSYDDEKKKTGKDVILVRDIRVVTLRKTLEEEHVDIPAAKYL